MEALFRGRWDEVVDATPSLRRQASGLTAAHLQWHLERQLRTLPLIERTAPHRLMETGVDTGVRRVDDGVAAG
jgi:DNA repair protein RecO (recombination protein O)